MARAATTADAFNAVAEPRRRQILDALAGGGRPAKHLVYEAWTTPELVKRWWTANRGEATIAEIDLRVGGSWRYVMVTDGGFEVGFQASTERSSRTSGSSRPRSTRAC